MKVSTASLSLFLAGGLLIPATTAAEEPSVTIVKPEKGDASSSRRVARDKDTGNLRPTTEAEDTELAAAARRSIDTGVLVVNRPGASLSRLPNGAAVAKRTAEDLEQLVGVQAPDGRLKVRHEAKRAVVDASSAAEEK